MGHLDQERQNLQSIRPQSSKKSTIITTVPNITPLDKTSEVLSMIVPFSAKSMTYGDLTGAFPYTFLRGAKYIYIMYDYDGSAILAEALKSRKAREITILENGCMKELQNMAILQNITF